MAASAYQHVTSDERGRGGVSRNPRRQYEILSSDAVTAGGKEEHVGQGITLTAPPLHQNVDLLNKTEDEGPPHCQEMSFLFFQNLVETMIFHCLPLAKLRKRCLQSPFHFNT
ncbi:hypothetical protein ILYODFUR_030946 [Ilyodon furcidens]|uniref:Uncharacterized protein n=1 Tax=Ilyodon furcidens TaxID=33524 RepID=A0ABV0VJE2_9TELE